LLITSDKQAGAGMDAPSGLPGDARASTGRIRLHRGLPAKSDEAIVPARLPARDLGACLRIDHIGGLARILKKEMGAATGGAGLLQAADPALLGQFHGALPKLEEPSGSS
jgi:hypothetical protein